MYREAEKDAFSKIPQSENIYYTFFTTGMLYWVLHSQEIIKDSCQRVFIAAGLTEEEKLFLKEHVRHPVFYLQDFCTDQDVWNMLLETCVCNFGWIDIDCFVSDPAVLQKMSQIKPENSFNCYWTGTDGQPFEQLKTYFLYVNIEAVKSVQKSGLPVHANAYSEQVQEHYATKPVPQQLVPVIQERIEPNQPLFFDTLVLFQLAAERCGYSICHVGECFQDGQVHAFHVGHSSYYTFERFKQFARHQDYNMKVHRQTLGKEQFEQEAARDDRLWKSFLIYYILKKYVNCLPVEYAILHKMIVNQLMDLFHIRQDEYKSFIQSYFALDQEKEGMLNLLEIQL